MERILTYAEAIREATEQAMASDPGVILFGIGVPDHKAIYGTAAGLRARFGAERVFESPLSEDAMTGFGIGAALAGLRPVQVHIRMDFMMLTMNQLVNIAAKAHYMYGGAVHVPIVVRGIIGRSWGQGGQHSQSLYSLFMHVPGLKVVAPSIPYDAKGILTQAIRDPNPVIFIEHRLVHRTRGHVPAESYALPFGKARVLQEGSDITLVGISYSTLDCVRAAGELGRAGIRAEVIDCVSLNPLDTDTIAQSVSKTGNLLVVDNDWTMCGASAEIVARLAERYQGHGMPRMRRLGFEPVTCPATKNLENLFYPSAQKIALTAHHLLKGEQGTSWIPDGREPQEVLEFKGPF